MLGRAWRELLDARAIPYQAPSHSQLDITSESQITQFIQRSGQLVINCAAWTDVDAAEANLDGALALNAVAPQQLAARCKAVGATLVHYSTDYVFDGQAGSPYTTDQPRDPLGAYGQSKAQGEEHIQASGCDHLIIRTSWLYASWGKNFVRTVAKLGQERDTLSVVNDQQGRPTSAVHLASTSLKLLGQKARGVVHVTDQGQCTWYDFAKEIVRINGSSCDVRPCSSEAFPRPAKRPAYSVLDLSKAEHLVGPFPTWQDNLANVMNHLEPLT